MRSLGGELAQHVFIRELAAAECGVRQVVLAGGLMTLTSAGAPPTSCMITGWSLITDHRPLERMGTGLAEKDFFKALAYPCPVEPVAINE